MVAKMISYISNKLNLCELVNDSLGHVLYGKKAFVHFEKYQNCSSHEKKVSIAALNQKKILNILYSEQGPIVLSFIGSRVCLSTLLHYCLANLKVFGKGGLC